MAELEAEKARKGQETLNETEGMDTSTPAEPAEEGDRD